MGFLDTLKETANSLGEKAADLAQSGVAQSRRLAEVAKLKTANIGEEDTIKKAYIEIGKLYYAEQGTSPDGAYAAACEKVTAAKAAIEANNARIQELKAEVGDSGNADAMEKVEELVEEASEEAAEVTAQVEETISEAAPETAEEAPAPEEAPKEASAEEEAPKEASAEEAPAEEAPAENEEEKPQE